MPANDKVGDLIVEDYNIRKVPEEQRCMPPALPRSKSKETTHKVKINIHCSRPGVVIGKGGADIENLRQDGGKACSAKLLR